MDGTRFDDLTRRFGQLLSRRRLLALSAGVALSPVVRRTASAQQNLCESNPSCPTDYGGYPGNCFTFETTSGECACLKSVMFVVCEHGDACSTDDECGVDMLCGDTGCSDGQGRCYRVCPDRETPSVCDEGLVNCDGQCRDLSSDLFHCGECGHQCEFGGDQIGEICVDSRCVCPPEYTGSCGQDYCTNEMGDRNNCGSCGNQCQDGQICCSGRCVSRDDAERFCEFCGYLGGWPQDCLGNEICDRGVCVAGESETAPSNVLDVSGPTGDLAYGVKNGDHWDIWVYSFDTRQNTQLTNGPTSDQWAPAYSHDGTQLAYLSDQTDGSNQIWLMDPNGGNQRQITDWHGAESILYVGWSPDDSQLIVTLFGDVRRLVLMPSGGGEFTDYVGPSSSFATTASDGTLIYALDFGDSISTSIYLGTFANPALATAFAQGDTPNISADAAYVLVQIGDPGFRHVESYPLSTEWSALPPPARAGDDSNPVWLTGNHDYLAFASAGPNGESIQVCKVGDVSATALSIAPHDRVWYLSKRFTGESSEGSSAAASGQPVEEAPTQEPSESAPDDVSNGNGYSSAQYGYSLEWSSVWEEQPEYSGIQDDGSERLVLWHTGNVIATVDLRAGGAVSPDLAVCVEDVVDQLRGENRFEDNVVPYDAPALVPDSGAEGRTVWNFLQRDYLYTYVECRALGYGAGTLRIVYQVPDDTYAKVYPDVVELLQSIQTG